MTHVIGVDPDRDWITVAALDSRTAGVTTTDRFPATSDGYRDAIAWADAHSEESERAWVIEGTASYGRGLTMALQRLDELVIEFDRPMRKANKDGAKSDALDAIRAAREALGRDKLNQPAPTTESEKPSFPAHSSRKQDQMSPERAFDPSRVALRSLIAHDPARKHLGGVSGDAVVPGALFLMVRRSELDEIITNLAAPAIRRMLER